LLVVLTLLCVGLIDAVQHNFRHEQMQHRSTLTTLQPKPVPMLKSVVDLDVAEPVVSFVKQETHNDKDSKSSNIEMMEVATEPEEPEPHTSFAAFDMSGKLAGTYDPFSQVRHLVDGVFHEHEERLKSEGVGGGTGAGVSASSFLEVRSYIRRGYSLPSSSSSHSSTHKLFPSSSAALVPTIVSPSRSTTAVYPIRFQSLDVMSSALGSQDTPKGYAVVTGNKDGEGGVSLLEMGSKVMKVQSFCEICILVMQMKQRGEPHLCAGLNANYYITCVEVLESILRADKALVYWLKEGCMHLDSDGPEIVRPCPAINICSWTPNLFTPPPTIVRDEVEALCPKDLRFLPTIPEEYRALLGA